MVNAHDATLTLCAAAVAGILLISLAARLQVPSIALLLVGGVLLGPEVIGIVQPQCLGEGLETVVALAVAVILFEGGLTLDIGGFQREPRVIVRMLTVGVVVTWVGAAAAVYFVYDELGVELALLAGSLVIVTGPTVVSPLLRRIGVQPRLHHILYWEGVLVDAVGVFVAVLCFEWIASGSGETLLTPLGRFASRFVVGTSIGVACGVAFGLVLRRGWVLAPHINIVVLAVALLAVAVSNAVLAESGILAVIVAGLVMSWQRVPQLRGLKRFKLELTEVGIGLLFVLLAAKLELEHFAGDPRLAVFLVLVLLVLRPINVWLSTWGRSFSWRERLFLSWLAPRGIVAASMASLLSLRLAELGYQRAYLLETLTYAVIASTVLVQGLSASIVARVLGLQQSARGAWLLVGHPELCEALQEQLVRSGCRVLILPTTQNLNEAFSSRPDVFSLDPLDPETPPQGALRGVEAVLAMDADPEMNRQVCALWSQHVGAGRCYRWAGDAGNGDSEAEGIALWTDIVAPGEALASLHEGTHVLEAVEVGSPEDARRFGKENRPLMALEDTRAVPVNRKTPTDADAVVVWRRRVPGLAGLVQGASVIDQENVSFEHTVRELLNLAAHGSQDFDIEDHLRRLMSREATMSTAVGGGVAIPHVHDNRVRRSVCYLGNVVQGLDIQGPDGVPVRLVFLVMSPSTMAQDHLRSLAAIAQLAGDEAFVDVLAAQRSRVRLLSLLHERE